MKIRFLIRDVVIIGASILVALLVIKLGIFDGLSSLSGAMIIVGSFCAGILFTSAFTIAPASVILVGLAQHSSLTLIVLVGAAGAVVGDLIIFFFIRDYVAHDIALVLKARFLKHTIRFFHTKTMRWAVPILGAVAIASPLPDEIGLAMMGFSKTHTRIIIPVSYAMNCVGIVLLGLLGRAF